MLKRFFMTERNVMIGIIINAIVIFLLYFPELHDNHVLLYIDFFFVLFFLFEAIVKIRVLSAKGYFKDSWNIFDFSIVLVSLPTLLSYFFFPIPNTSFFKILRLFRLIRLVRFVRFIPRLEMIVQGLTRAIKASVFVLAALFFLNFILALFTCHFYGEYAEEFFGNPLVASYSIFQMFTIEGWNEIPAVIAERMGGNDLLIGLMRFYFAMVVLVGGIFGMSLANAVFVDEMTMDNNQELEAKIDTLQEEIRDLKRMLSQNNKA